MEEETRSHTTKSQGVRAIRSTKMNLIPWDTRRSILKLRNTRRRSLNIKRRTTSRNSRRPWKNQRLRSKRKGTMLMSTRSR